MRKNVQRVSNSLRPETRPTKAALGNATSTHKPTVNNNTGEKGKSAYAKPVRIKQGWERLPVNPETVWSDGQGRHAI